MLRLLAFVLASAALLFAPAALTPARADAKGPPRAFFGVMVNGPLDADTVDLDARAADMTAAGVGSWRVEMAWDAIEPAPGQFAWGATDRKVLTAARHGIDVLGLALRAPAWANGGSPDPFVPPRRPAAFAGYLRALIGRYGPRGSLWAEHPEVPRRAVRAWEIWNEPNLVDYFRTQPFQKPYAALLRAAYPAVKAADPGATVLMASMANFSWRDLARLLSVGGPRLRFDAAGAHPFSGRPSNALKIVRLNREALDRRGYRRVPLWLTELTWSSAKGKKQPLTQNWETTEAGQAQRLREMYGLLLRNRTRLRLARVFWYTWATVDAGSQNSFDYSGLTQALPDGTFRAKPALGAFRAVARAAATR
ncbi:endo-1,4-beta-xylanase [Baekduia soli]|uniref:Endo-1,4-beta-xylanase n=1 Tax=Baekduia soli TaxID=496014 RepID=A0A5B8U9B3_9ACTN|nr:endo-1,4-beta-xylanase [Baekduia soli]QEC49595.1 endo-1,4-beta-xylanase [Baekduia soli]